jgi:hypothetical protein
LKSANLGTSNICLITRPIRKCGSLQIYDFFPYKYIVYALIYSVTNKFLYKRRLLGLFFDMALWDSFLLLMFCNWYHKNQPRFEQQWTIRTILWRHNGVAIIINIIQPYKLTRVNHDFEVLLHNVGSWNASTLKVPKRENFSIAFFALREPIWMCDIGTAEKIEFFYQLTPDFDGFWFFAAYWVCGKKKILKLSQN